MAYNSSHRPTDSIVSGSERQEAEHSILSNVSAGFKHDIEATNRLSEFLDRERSNSINLGADVQNRSPSEVLHKLLSLRSVVSTTSSFAVFNESMRYELVGYRKIGFGQCGLILERPGRSHVTKISRPNFEDALWNDMVSHISVYKAFSQQKKPTECRVPAPYNFLRKTNTEWWDSTQPYLPEGLHDISLPSNAMITERILPLPRVVRDALINLFCPENLRSSVAANPANRDCLARIYLGKRRLPNAPLPPNFSLRNYNLHLDQMLSLQLPTGRYAEAMAEALALIHWSAHRDGYDIEFVLGSEADTAYTTSLGDRLAAMLDDIEASGPLDLYEAIHAKFKKRTSRMWVLDFNLCTRWTEEMCLEFPEEVISQLVMAFFENDPYYPLPLMEQDTEKRLWSLFRNEYLRKAEEILRHSDNYDKICHLPNDFIEACVAREQLNLEQGKGHGHRDLKG